jgi:hypothetical protein
MVLSYKMIFLKMIKDPCLPDVENKRKQKKSIMVL